MQRMSSLARWWPLLVIASAPRPALADAAPEAAPARSPDQAARLEALRTIPPGARIRVALPAGPQVGTFYGATADTLLLDEGNLQPARHRLELIRGLELSKGRESRTLQGLGWGLLAGATVGVIATLALGRGGDEDDYFLEYTLLPPVAVGAIVGAVIGSSRSAERWEQVARW